MLNGHSRNNYAQLSLSLKLERTSEGWFEAPGAHHIVSGNVSKTEPAKFLVVFIVGDKDELVTMYK